NFAPNLGGNSLLFPHTERLLEIYGQNPLDPRYELNWEYHPVLLGRYPTYIRYKVDQKLAYMPLIRMSEVYLIAAECEGDENRSLAYLNELRRHRRLSPFGPDIDVDKEIYNSYRREFWGEGQTFFYMKRKFLKRILKGSNVSGERSMTKQDYVIPIPESEQTQR